MREGGMMAWGRNRGPEDLRTRGPESAGRRFWRLKAEGLTPERLTAVAVTRHLE